MQSNLVEMASGIVSAYVSRNMVPPAAVPGLVKTVHGALARLTNGAPPEPQKPAVPVAKSVHHNHIICLEDGKRLTMLKRYLRTHYDMSPEDYRRKWGLPHDYPMVAPAYAELRSAF